MKKFEDLKPGEIYYDEYKNAYMFISFHENEAEFLFAEYNEEEDTYCSVPNKYVYLNKFEVSDLI